MIVIALLTLFLVSYGVVEFRYHKRRVRSIPIRIHVNGTRGKSSVTRLIAAGLRAGGLKTLAKVTGTLPRIIDNEGLEIPIIRLHPVNILEQVKVFKYFKHQAPDAVVIECMAVMPDYQWMCEHRFVDATAGVITNSRMDHVIEMGPTIENITNSLANTIPQDAPVFTAEEHENLLEIFRHRAKQTNSRVINTHEADIDEEIMREFTYIEHPANVVLALKVCTHIGIDEKIALDGMTKAYPDPGALFVYTVERSNKKALFLSALAANDPESTQDVWERTQKLYPDAGKRIILLNTRADRFNRSVQLVEMIGANIEFDLLISMGKSTDMLTQHIKRAGIPSEKVVNIGFIGAEKSYEKIWEQIDDRAFLFACGNAGQGGLAVSERFKKDSNRSKKSMKDFLFHIVHDSGGK
jgi:gamma-polyglutamate synthase